MDSGGLEHVVVVNAGERQLVPRSGFVKEADLQALILNSPELLGALGADLRFIPIGREVRVGPGWLDLLFLDSSGTLTLVETKLKANDESRRAVTGQILEYAAFASEWTVDQVRTIAQTFLASPYAPGDLHGKNIEEAVSSRLGWMELEEDERRAKFEALFARLEASLLGGFLRIVCGVDEKIENLERLVRYLSLHSDLQVVLLQVNRFPVDTTQAVLVPTLHGDVEGQPGRPNPAPAGNLSVASIIESFPAGDEREFVARLIQNTAAAGALFEPGPSGMSIRVRTPVQKQPVTVAWIYPPGNPGWMKTHDLSFGHGLDYPSTAPQLLHVLTGYHQRLVGLDSGQDASSKGVRARWMTANQASKSAAAVESTILEIIEQLRELRFEQ